MLKLILDMNISSLLPPDQCNWYLLQAKAHAARARYWFLTLFFPNNQSRRSVWQQLLLSCYYKVFLRTPQEENAKFCFKKGFIYFFIFTNNVEQQPSDSNLLNPGHSPTLYALPKNKICGLRGTLTRKHPARTFDVQLNSHYVWNLVIWTPWWKCE